MVGEPIHLTKMWFPLDTTKLATTPPHPMAKQGEKKKKKKKGVKYAFQVIFDHSKWSQYQKNFGFFGLASIAEILRLQLVIETHFLVQTGHGVQGGAKVSN